MDVKKKEIGKPRNAYETPSLKRDFGRPARPAGPAVAIGVLPSVWQFAGAGSVDLASVEPEQAIRPVNKRNSPNKNNFFIS